VTVKTPDKQDLIQPVQIEYTTNERYEEIEADDESGRLTLQQHQTNFSF
jgi:hypothetical protein